MPYSEIAGRPGLCESSLPASCGKWIVNTEHLKLFRIQKGGGKRMDTRKTDLVIIGAGTAGMTAAIYAQRAGKQSVMLEALSYGGQIINSPDVENYPGLAHVSGFEFATALYEQAKGLGAEFRFEKALAIEERDGCKVVKTAKNEYFCKAVILATGAKNRPLGLENETRLTGAGISYCATCDGAFYRGRTVAVNGGGNTALEDAAYLADLCEKVYLIHRREAFRGDARYVEKLREKPNVEFVLNATVKEILGADRVSGIVVADKLSGEDRTIPVDGLFIAIGQIPDNRAFSGWVELDENGYIRAGEDCHTGTPGIYTAGDCRTKTVRQLTTAAADGAVAALAACAESDLR